MECEKCSGTGLILVKNQDKVCGNCLGTGSITPIAPTIRVEEPVIKEEKEVKVEKPVRKGFLSRAK